MLIDVTRMMFFVIFLLYNTTECGYFGWSKPKNKVLLISFDGFRYDYLDLARQMKKNISSFEKLWSNGIRAHHVKNQFITKTFPNHISIVTGLHVENHGIVNNRFYDPKLNDTFQVFRTESKWFDTGAEPIWVTNQLHGHQTGVYMWVGSQTEIKGVKPTYYATPYSTAVPLSKRIKSVIKWLLKDKVTLALLYYHEPDRQGHIHGAGTKEVLQAIEKLNDDLAVLLESIEKSAKLRDRVNIIVTSDHGMTTFSQQKLIYMDELIDPNLYHTLAGESDIIWPMLPKNGIKPQEIYDKIAGKHEHLNVYLRENIPAQLYYSKNVRIAPVVAYAKPKWLIVASRKSGQNLNSKGGHGYDPEFEEMNPFFLASGPDFNNLTEQVPIVHMTDIYPLICYLLNLYKPAPNNGSLDRVSSLLRYPPGKGLSHFETCQFLLFINLIIVRYFYIYTS